MGSSSNGGSGEGSGAHDEAPVCRHTTVAVSSQAAKKGSHCAAEDGGEAELRRELGEADRLEAACRVAPHLGRGHRDVGQPGQLQRDDALGVGAGPHLQVPVVEGAQAGQAQRRIAGPRETAPQKPDTSDGKHSEAQIPARSMSAIRASMSKQPGRISSNRAGSMLHSSWGRPTTAFRPDVGVTVSLEDPALRLRRRPRRPGARRRPASAGRRPSNRSGGSMRWSSTEITGTLIALGVGVGEQRGPAGRGPCLDGSHEKVTLSSATSSGPGGAHDHTRRGRRHPGRTAHRRRGRGRGAGTYPVTNPARPAEVVLDAPSTSPAQLDQAVAAARRSQRGVGLAGHRGPGAAGSWPPPRPAWRRSRPATGPSADPGARQDAPGGDLRHRHHGRHGVGLRPAGGPGARRP